MPCIKCCCCPCGGPGKLAEVPNTDEGQFTFVELDESSMVEAVEVGTRAFNGGDGLPGELANDWVLKGGGEIMAMMRLIPPQPNVFSGIILEVLCWG